MTSNLHTEKEWRCDADDRKQMTIEAQRTAERPRIAAKLSLPERVTDYRSGLPARQIVVFSRENPTQHWRHAEVTEELSAHVESIGISGFPARREVKARRAPGQHARKRLLLFPNLLPLAISEPGAARGEPAGAERPLGKID